MAGMRKGGPNVFLGYLIPLVVIGLTIADFVPDQKVDKLLLGLLLIFGLGALGYRLDEIVGKAIADKVAENLPSGIDDKDVGNNPSESG